MSLALRSPFQLIQPGYLGEVACRLRLRPDRLFLENPFATGSCDHPTLPAPHAIATERASNPARRQRGLSVPVSVEGQPRASKRENLQRYDRWTYHLDGEREDVPSGYSFRAGTSVSPARVPCRSSRLPRRRVPCLGDSFR